MGGRFSSRGQVKGDLAQCLNSLLFEPQTTTTPGFFVDYVVGKQGGRDETTLWLNSECWGVTTK